MYSFGMPRMKPAISRPPLITSSIAYSSATRTGLFSGSSAPSMAMRIRLVRCVRAAPISAGLLISQRHLVDVLLVVLAGALGIEQPVRHGPFGRLLEVRMRHQVKVAELHHR